MNATREFEAACKRQRELIRDGAMPADVLLILEREFSDIPPHAKAELDAHLVDLTAFGDTWPLRAITAGEGIHRRDVSWLMPDGRRVPFTHPWYPAGSMAPRETQLDLQEAAS